MRRWIVIPDHVRVVGNGFRAAISDRIAGLSADVIAELVAEVGPLWQKRRQAGLESRPRQRATGAKHGWLHRPTPGHAGQAGGGPAVEILADAGYQGLGEHRSVAAS